MLVALFSQAWEAPGPHPAPPRESRRASLPQACFPSWGPTCSALPGCHVAAGAGRCAVELRCPGSRGRREGRPGCRHQEAKDRLLLDRGGVGGAPAQPRGWPSSRGPECWGQTLLHLAPGADLVWAPVYKTEPGLHRGGRELTGVKAEGSASIREPRGTAPAPALPGAGAGSPLLEGRPGHSQTS